MSIPNAFGSIRNSWQRGEIKSPPKKAAKKMLGIYRPRLYSKMEKYGIGPEPISRD